MQKETKKESSFFYQTQIANRIRKCAETLGGNSNLAERAGISESQLYRVLSGGNTSIAFLARIAEATGQDFNWIVTGDTNNCVAEPGPNYKDSFDFELIDELHTSAVEEGEMAVTRQRLAFRREWLEQRHLEARNLAVVRHRGDTMQPTLLDGDALLIRVFHHKDGDAMRLGLESITSIDDGLYLVKIGSTQKVLRVCLRSTDQLQLISDNDRYPPRLVSLTEDASPAEITIVGSVLWIGRWLNH